MQPATPNREGFGEAIRLLAKKNAGISNKIPASLGDAPEGGASFAGQK
jgi:hypothetical protein